MGRISYENCEPFRAWNRLEPRPRKEDFDKNLQVGVHDALWFLTRQWQFGEFKGEDTGSAIFSKLLLQTTQLSHYQALNDMVQPYLDATPLEETVEQTAAPLNDKTRIQSGKFFRKILNKAGQGIAGFSETNYRKKLSNLFKYNAPQNIDAANDTPTQIIDKAKLLANSDLAQFADFFAEEDFDGYLLYLSIKDSLNNTATNLALSNAHIGFIKGALAEYLTLFDELYVEELNEIKGAWNKQQLEYQFKAMLPDENSTKTLLTADEYFTGDLEWYSVDIDKRNESENTFGTTPIEQDLVKNHVMTVIPTEARFSGMPNSRWWQFENGLVDLANFKADTTDIANLVFSEYAFMYSNDWHIIPITMKVGTLAEVKGIIVKDVFGEREFIKSAVQGQTDNWTGWGMYNLSTKLDVFDSAQPVDTRLFLAPSTVKSQESKPIEQVNFLRDEMANMVWAIENKLDSGIGKGVDGQSLVNNFKQILEKIEPKPDVKLEEGVAYQYQLGNAVPENWIPFIPVHVDGQNRAIQFQRAAMPRTFQGLNTPIRPNTTLLKIEELAGKVKPFYIHEEEIPRAGAKVMSSYQRTRWYNGKVVSWYGNRKTLGKGEGSSGLAFDQLLAASKAK